MTVALRRELGEGTEDAMASVYFLFTPSGTAHRPPPGNRPHPHDLNGADLAKGSGKDCGVSRGRMACSLLLSVPQATRRARSWGCTSDEAEKSSASRNGGTGHEHRTTQSFTGQRHRTPQP